MFIHLLCNRYPEQRFVLCGEKRFASIFAGIPNLTYLSRDAFLYKWIFRFVNLPVWIYNKLCKNKEKKLPLYRLFEYVSRHSRNNILISGSAFMESGAAPFTGGGDLRNEESYFALKPHVIGCNFGPYIHEEFKTFYAERFRQACYVCFREKKSYEMFSGENIHYAPDIVFTHPENISGEQQKKHVLLSVMNVEKDGNENEMLREAYLKEMVLLVEHLQKQGEKVVLLGFCKEQGDEETIREIKANLQSTSDVSCYCYPDTGYEEALRLLQDAKSVIATRYHAMILGWLFGSQVLPVVYSDKMKNVINDLTPGACYVSVEELDGSGVMVSLYEKMKVDTHVWDVSDVVAKAQKNFLSLDKLFARS